MPQPLPDVTIGRFLERLATPEPGPGGGSIAALTLAHAAGLVLMVARRSRETWPEAGGVAAQAQAIQSRALPLVDSDATAWVEALDALETRGTGLAAKLDRAAEVPLRIGELAADLAELAALAAERGEGTYRGDAAAAALFADAAARVAEKLVAVNLTMTPTDGRRAVARDNAAAAAAWAARALETGP